MIKAYIDFWKRALDFKGRSNRPDYWWAYLVNTIVTLVLGVFVGVLIFYIIFNISDSSSPDDDRLISASVLTYVIAPRVVGLIFLIPQLSLQSRRLRDAGFHPAWAALLLLAWIPAVWVPFVTILSLFGTIALIVMSCMPTKDEPITVIDQD